MQFYYILSPRVSPSSIVFRLLLRLPQPGEEGRNRLEGHALTMLLSGVFARLPLVESILRDDVLVVQTVKEHPEKVWKSTETWATQIKPEENMHHTTDFPVRCPPRIYKLYQAFCDWQPNLTLLSVLLQKLQTICISVKSSRGGIPVVCKCGRFKRSTLPQATQLFKGKPLAPQGTFCLWFSF